MGMYDELPYPFSILEESSNGDMLRIKDIGWILILIIAIPIQFIDDLISKLIDIPITKKRNNHNQHFNEELKKP